MRRSRLAIGLGLLLLLAGCGAASETPPAQPAPADAAALEPFGPPPSVRNGALPDGAREHLDRLFGDLASGLDAEAVAQIGRSEDARVAWLLSDLLRFFQSDGDVDALLDSFRALTGVELTGAERERSWKAVTDRLIAWDLPAPPGYVAYKAKLFTLVEPGWAPFFDDADSSIDWRLVSWGGVLIDDRGLGNPLGCPRGCIPALDDPAVTDADGGSWYADDRLVFGVVVDGEARAYPKHIMEVHELVNDTLGGRRIGVPYCTLCGSAQAYFTDRAGGDDLVLRTSGLLSRSNKVMYDLRTRSVLDTFTGRALSGPLQDAGVELEQLTVVTATWGEWKTAYPETTIVARDGGIGVSYPDDPLQGRDDDGPIFAIGPVDPRLPVQTQVVGVLAPDGDPVAFPADTASEALRAGREVELSGVHLELDGGGLRARLADGAPVVSHQAFWFAWSQFHPATALWTPLS